MSKAGMTRTLNWVCAGLALVLLVMQFTPFWYMGEGTEPVSIGGYVWFPSAHGEVTSYLQEKVSSDFRVNDTIVAPILMLLLSAASVVLCIVKAKAPLCALLPVACGAAGLIGFLTTPALRLGATWMIQLLLCLALLAVGAWVLVQEFRRQA
ncbi:MAG: hypothetical protein ACI4MJ_09355 [Aristaeellaceae bacterium]